MAENRWLQLKAELSSPANKAGQTIEQFSRVFMEKHARVRMRSAKRYELSFKTLNAKLGNIELQSFHRRHLHDYVEWRARHVKPNTVNRDIACIKKMFSFALDLELIQAHPLVRFRLLPVQEVAFQVMTVSEFRSLVDAIEEPALSTMVAVIGETGIRKSEALALKWDHVDSRSRMLTVEQTKSGKVREIPLSHFATSELQRLIRRLDSPFVFINTRTGRRWVNPEKAFKGACEAAGLAWVGFHDLRRFRATQWVRSGVDIRTVKELLGHADIKTTLRYARFAKSALREVREIQRAEEQNIRKSWETNGRQSG